MRESATPNSLVHPDVRAALPPTLARADVRAALFVAAAITLLTALLAVVAWAWDPEGVRRALDFTFPKAPRRLSEVGSILVNNLRLLAAVGAACLIVQMLRPTLRAGRAEALVARVLIVFCDAVLLIGCAVHVALVGLGIGAYGGRMVEALLPHAPIELAGFSFALGLYLAARREPLELRRGLAAAGMAVTLLVVGAVAEVYLPPT